MLAESTEHFKVAVGQSVRYACFRENWIRFRSAVELSVEVKARIHKRCRTHRIKLGKTLHDLIEKIVLCHEKANTV